MHAAVITAYTDFPSLERLIRRLDPAFFRIYVHVDLRSAYSDAEISLLRSLGCNLSRNHRIRWGSITHLYALLDLIRLATQADDIDYVHLLTGQDYPIADMEQFATKCDGRIFMEHSPLALESEYIQNRYHYFDIFHFMQGGSRITARLYRDLTRISLFLQKLARIRRRRFGPFSELYKGLVWVSLPRKAASRLVCDDLAVKFLRAVRTTYIAEEIFIQSYVMNTDLRAQVVNDNLRYMDWAKKNGSIPGILDVTDAEVILNSDVLFARKMHSRVSGKLLDRIDSAVFERNRRPASGNS